MSKPYKYFKSENANAKTIVIVSGSAEGCSRWEPFLALLLIKFNVLLIDNPGIGNVKEEDDFTSDELAYRYQGYINDLGIDKYFLIGHSFGGFIAQHMAANQQDKIEKLVLIGTGFGSFNHARTIKWQLELIEKVTKNPETNHFHELFGKTKVSNEFLEEYREEKKNIPPKVKLAYLINSARHTSFNVTKDILAPTLILHGTDDFIVDFENALQLNQLIKGSELLKVEGAGHYPFIEDSSVLSSILKFLEGASLGSIVKESKFNINELKQKDDAFKKATCNQDLYIQFLKALFINEQKQSSVDLSAKYIAYIK